MNTLKSIYSCLDKFYSNWCGLAVFYIAVVSQFLAIPFHNIIWAVPGAIYTIFWLVGMGLFFSLAILFDIFINKK